jgi:hypothetical protein
MYKQMRPDTLQRSDNAELVNFTRRLRTFRHSSVNEYGEENVNGNNRDYGTIEVAVIGRHLKES